VNWGKTGLLPEGRKAARYIKSAEKRKTAVVIYKRACSVPYRKSRVARGMNNGLEDENRR
jgi:hypothetical protein